MENINTNNLFELYEDQYQKWKSSTPENREIARNNIDKKILRIAEEEINKAKTPVDIFMSQAKFCYCLWLNDICEYGNMNRLCFEDFIKIFGVDTQKHKQKDMKEEEVDKKQDGL